MSGGRSEGGEVRRMGAEVGEMALENGEGGTVEDGEVGVKVPPDMAGELDCGEGVGGAGEGELAGGLDGTARRDGQKVVARRVGTDKGVTLSRVGARDLERDGHGRHKGEIAFAGRGDVPGGGNGTKVAEGADGGGAGGVESGKAGVIAVNEGDSVGAHEVLIEPEALIQIGRGEDDVVGAVGGDSNVGVIGMRLEKGKVGRRRGDEDGRLEVLKETEFGGGEGHDNGEIDEGAVEGRDGGEEVKLERGDDARRKIVCAGDAADLGEGTGHFRHGDKGLFHRVGGEADKRGTDGEHFIMNLVEEGVDGIDAKEKVVGIGVTVKVPSDTDDVLKLSLYVGNCLGDRSVGDGKGGGEEVGLDELVEAGHGEGGGASAEDVAEAAFVAREDGGRGECAAFVDIVAGVSDEGLIVPAVDTVTDELGTEDEVVVDLTEPILVDCAGVFVMNGRFVARGVVDKSGDFRNGGVAQLEGSSEIDLELEEGECGDLVDAANVKEGETGLTIGRERE